METLEECNVDDLDSREIFYIAKYNTFEKGYNLTIGGGGKRKIISDSQYEEIEGLYLSGFTTYKIAALFRVDKATITKILKVMGVKMRSDKIQMNHQEFLELVSDYKSGYSLRELAKRYDCSAPGLKEYLKRKGVDIQEKYSILEDEESQQALIKDYLDKDVMTKDIFEKYHVS
ncbi:MAG: hypothetical protein LBE56_12560 [Tannerella sp.]|nr:hypothetical protein [Tannerella sp.]